VKNRFWLFRRDGVFCLQDAETRRKESLHTRDRDEAVHLCDTRDDAAKRPIPVMAFAKVYLSAHDAEIAEQM
jgi:hypothetical protein